MWTILNINLNKINFFQKELAKKLGPDFKIYYPKFRIKIFKNKKSLDKKIPLLGNYIFCFHKKFESNLFVQNIKFVRGLNYVLSDYSSSQKDIEKFILSCKKNEDQDGYIIQNFLNVSLNQFYKFKSGLLANKIFKLIDLQKNKIKVLINNLKFEINKKDLIILPNN